MTLYNSAHLPPLLGGVQLLLDLLQRGLPAWGRGRLQLGAAVEGGRLQDDLEGLAAGTLAQFDHLHVADVAQVQVHHAGCKRSRGRLRPAGPQCMLGCIIS